MSSLENKLIYDFASLMLQFEAAPDAQGVRDVLKDYENERKYKNIIENGGFEAISWVGKQIVKMKEKQNV